MVSAILGCLVKTHYFAQFLTQNVQENVQTFVDNCRIVWSLSYEKFILLDQNMIQSSNIMTLCALNGKRFIYKHWRPVYE